jgi:hypothetical protein
MHCVVVFGIWPGLHRRTGTFHCENIARHEISEAKNVTDKSAPTLDSRNHIRPLCET